MIKTEIGELDHFWNSGLKPGGLIVIAARPGMGKTGFLLSIGNRIAQKHKTQLISLENSIKRLNRYNLSDSILIDDCFEINVERLSELISQNKPEVVLIDYIQLMTGNRESLIKDLKNIAVKFNICMLVNSQIRRELEYREISDRRPKISDLMMSRTLFNSESIAYIDHLTFFYREHYYNRDSQKPDTIELIQYYDGNLKVVQLGWQ